MSNQASNLETLIKRVGARIPTSVTPATRIEIHPSEWLELANELVEPTAPTTAQAFDALRAAIKADPAYAWSWHCNLAMPMIDSGVADALANESAARLMQHLFGFDSRTCKEWGTHRGAGETSAVPPRALIERLHGFVEKTTDPMGYNRALWAIEEALDSRVKAEVTPPCCDLAVIGDHAHDCPNYNDSPPERLP